MNVSDSLSLLARRIDEVAAEVTRALRAPVRLPVEIGADARWISTGVGASEGPARLLASLLRARGVVADFAPISSFAGGLAPPAADVCVVVSQCLSPNARLPLAWARRYRHTLLVTTAPDAPDVTLVRHGPTEESGLLLRVVGPAAATATVMRLAGSTFDLDGVEGAFASAQSRALASVADPSALFDLVGIAAVGDDVATCDGLRHKILEGLGRRLPPAWDVVGLVHGPLQSFYESRAAVLVLEREGSSELISRLERVLHPERHTLLRLRSHLPAPLALLDFDLQLDHLVLAALRQKPRDLARWPGQGCDTPLYELGKQAI